jgi:RNA polymerase sigma factor (TIGR02999 family)
MIEGRPITELLNAWQAGDRAALDRLIELVYPELAESARRAMARERDSHTLEPTALVNEVYLRLQKTKGLSWESRGQFFVFAAGLMRRLLVEHARAHGAKKRGGESARVSLEGAELATEEPAIDPLVLEEALKALEEVDPRLVRVVELRVFAGYKEGEIAEALGLGRATVQRDWALAKRVLAKFLSDTGGREAS